MLMKQLLIRVLKTIFSDVRQAAVPAILLLLVGGSAGLFLFSQKALDFAIHIANMPTPLWVTIVLAVLYCGYIYVTITKIPIASNKANQAKKSTNVVKYFNIGNYKWKTTIYENDYFEVDKCPLCIKHDLKFIYGSREKYCPGTEKEKCNNKLSEYDEFKIYSCQKHHRK